MPIAIITGTSTGIGQASAVALARAGFVVYAGMRNLGAAEPLKSVASNENVRIVPIRIDVDDDASVDEAIAGVLRAEGRVDLLVNNAGVGGGVGAVEEMPLDEFREVMETNFFGVHRCTKAVLPGMRARRSGCIINVSSVAGRIANAPQSAYAASKWAVEAMTECLAQEMKAFNVRVALIEPGVIATAIFGKVPPLIENSPYPQGRRLMALFNSSLEHPVPPDIVAVRIVAIAKGETDLLRHPVGPDAEPFIAWRRSKTDEEMVAMGAFTDAEYMAMAKAEFGLDLDL
ncbi:MAG TPA: SDR family oxidoreductase [Caulobacteraceae bacterium]|nr:SDR family oxidoreductase [Caulobacteraceae bacterium]